MKSSWFARLFRRSEPARVPGPGDLISVLLDRTAPVVERDDAALDLSLGLPGYGITEVEEALLVIARDPTEDEDLLDRAGESLGRIWSQKSEPPTQDILLSMQPIARAIATAILRKREQEILRATSKTE